MKGFLEQVATYLHRVYDEDLHRFCIVFPNVRAGLFFRKYLAQLSGKPVWAPAFRSLDSLMEEISGLTQADSLSMIFDLFRAFQQHKSTDESFEEFYFWGEMLLNDFDDVDKHLVDARDLFRNVSDLKEIDLLFDYMTEEQKEAIRVFWQDFNGGNSGQLKTDFSSIWELLYPIYKSFKQRLKEKSLGYGGMIQREAVRLLRKGEAAHAPYAKYVFIGFNALTTCESAFFKSLQKQDKAIFFWDYDDYYLTNQWHEAGIFMRDNIRNFPSEWNFDTRNLIDPSKHIEISSVPSDTGQAKLAGQLLENFYSCENARENQYDWSRTAVVLPDEHLLLPMLSSLPDAARDINITMGYPFTYSPVNSLFERLASLQQHIRNYADGPRFFHRDVCMILYHPYIQEILPDKARDIVKNIIEYNRIYISAKEISGHSLLQLLFKPCTQALEFSKYLLDIVSEIVAGLSPISDDEVLTDEKNQSLQLEYLYTFYTTLQRTRDVLETNQIDMDVQTFYRLLRKVFASLKIPFSGEPLKGLQLMGMLETRALDFDRVIIMSMNEGILPKSNPKQSFIPYHLRKGFGLTTPERYDAVSAYHFYRLIQRANDVRLIYNSAATDRNTSEMSRFLSQLIYEQGFNVQQRNITFHVNIDRDIPIIKERTDEVHRILGLYLTEKEGCRRLSPSAVNSYLDCRLKFYFRYVEGLKEMEEVTDEIDQSVFGKLLHKTMELIYQPYVGKDITIGILTQLQKDQDGIKDALFKAFAEDYFQVDKVTDDDITGRNIIIREVLLKFVMRILEVDKTAVPFKIISLEEELKVRIPVRNEDLTVHLNMQGYIDRLDIAPSNSPKGGESPSSGGVGEALRIIDYKTGNAQRNFTDIADLFDRNKNGNHAAMQTLLYAYMTHIAHGEYTGISSELYVMRDLFTEGYDPRIYISHKQPVDNYFDIAEDFEPELNNLLSEMFLSDTPFTQTENTNKCLTCIYADICHRKRK